MATVLEFSQSLQPPDQLSLVPSVTEFGFARRVEFGAFLDRRMREHRTWQNRELEDLTEEIFREVLDYTGQKLQQAAARAR